MDNQITKYKKRKSIVNSGRYKQKMTYHEWLLKEKENIEKSTGKKCEIKSKENEPRLIALFYKET